MDMGINYTVLKSSIINSSIWNEDAETCKVWITMLAMRNKDGEIFASVGGLAHQARLSPEITRKALDKFLSTEPDSSSRDDGRRIVEISGGWRLLNHEKIAAEARAASKAAYMRDYMKKKRSKKTGRGAPKAFEQSAVNAHGNGDENAFNEAVTASLPAALQ
jgi:hypothetical protein